jgi:hypothetical protein
VAEATVNTTDIPVAPAENVRASRPRIGPPWLVALLVVGYMAIVTTLPILAGGIYLCNNDFGGIFLPSANYVLNGAPLDMYRVRIGLYPNANGPLGEVIIAGVVAVGRVFHLQQMSPLCIPRDGHDSLPLRMWLTFIFGLLPLGMGAEIMRLSDRWRPKPFTDWQRLAVWATILVSIPLWDSIVYYGHFEQALEIWLALLAVRFFSKERFVLAGFLLGLALLNRTAGIFVAIPLALLLVRDLRWQQLFASLRRLLAFSVSLIGTVTLGLVPFYLHDKQDLVYSLSTFRAQEPILDGSFWTFVRGTPWETPLQSWDSNVAIALAIVFSIAILWGARVRASDPALYGVICVSVVCFSIGLKAIWGYYFAEPLIWGLAWILASRNARQQWWEIGVIPFFFTLLMGMTEMRISLAGVPSALGATPGIYGVPIRLLVLVTSAAEFLSLIAFNIAVATLLIWQQRRAARDSIPLPMQELVTVPVGSALAGETGTGG